MRSASQCHVFSHLPLAYTFLCPLCVCLISLVSPLYTCSMAFISPLQPSHSPPVPGPYQRHGSCSVSIPGLYPPHASPYSCTIKLCWQLQWVTPWRYVSGNTFAGEAISRARPANATCSLTYPLAYTFLCPLCVCLISLVSPLYICSMALISPL